MDKGIPTLTASLLSFYIFAASPPRRVASRLRTVPGLNIPSNLFHINTPQYFHRTNFPAFQVSFSKTSKAEL